MDGQRIASLRKAKGWSQQQLAIRAGLHAQTISHIERGVRGVEEPRLSTVEALARALEIEVDVLLAEPDPEPGSTPQPAGKQAAS